MSKREKLGRYLLVLGAFGLLTFIALKLGGIRIVVADLGLLLSGRFREIANGSATFGTMCLIVLATIILSLPCAIGADFLSKKILGKHDQYELDKILDKKLSSLLIPLLVVNAVEELLSRYLFLGVFTKIPILSGTTAFYALFLIGNSIWALLHLTNYKEKRDRKILRVLPQFILGISITYVFVKYGFFGAVMAHFMINVLALAGHKVIRNHKSIKKLEIRINSDLPATMKECEDVAWARMEPENRYLSDEQLLQKIRRRAASAEDRRDDGPSAES